MCAFTEPNLTTYVAAPACVVNQDPTDAKIRNKGHTQASPALTATTMVLRDYTITEVLNKILCGAFALYHTLSSPPLLSGGME